jgi:hypothetical protein
MQLNPVLWWNPNLIYPGQVLCLPGVSRPPRALALEASYEYAPQAEIPVLQGKRATFHLTEARVVTDAAKLESAIKGSPAPAAMILKNTNAPGYALYEIGKNTLTLSTVVTPTAALNLEEGCNAIAPVNTALSSMQALKTTMELAIERPDGFRVPLEITDVGLLDQPDKIFTCGSDRIVSILFPVRGQSNAYWALVPGKELQPISGPSPWYIPFSFFFGGWSYY